MKRMAFFNRRLVVVFMLASLLMLGACGFRMRGQAALNLDSIYLTTPENSALGFEMRRYLRANGVKVRDTEKAAQAILDILNEKREEAVLSFTPSGTAREIELRYQLQFRVRSPVGEELVAPRQLDVRRELLVTAGLVLPQESERAALYRDMQSDAVAQIVRQLEFVQVPSRTSRKP